MSEIITKITNQSVKHEAILADSSFVAIIHGTTGMLYVLLDR